MARVPSFPAVLAWLALGVLSLPAGANAASGQVNDCSAAAWDAVRDSSDDRRPAAILAFAEGCPTSPQRVEALRLAARFALQGGENDAAVRLLRQIPDRERTPGDRLDEGVALVRSGAAAAGMKLLQGVDAARLTSEEAGSRLLALGDAARQAGDPTAALVALAEASRHPSAGIASSACDSARRLLRNDLSGTDLALLGSKVPPSPVRLDLLVEQARRGARKDPAAAKRLLDEVLTAQEPYPWREEALQLRDTLEGGLWLQRGIGVVLPLSGKFATFGEAVRRGIDLALAERPEKARRINFVFRDIDSDAEANRTAVEDLARRDRVMAVVGPLTGNAALAAAEAAQAERIPLISLSQRDGIPEIGDFVFRDALTNLRQIDALLDYAVAKRRLARLAILAPLTRPGQEMARLFADRAQQRGAKIVARQDYPEGISDFRTPVKLLKGEDPAIPDPVDREARRHVRATAAPALPFDALFIPDSAENVGLIAPYLAFYGIENVLLLGPSSWNAPALLEKSPRYLEGAVFVDAFHPGSARPQVQHFVERYLELYGEEPSILEAVGYDLANLLCQLLDRNEIRTRTELKQALERLKPVPGVTGTLAFGLNGESTKPLALLTVQNGLLTEIE